MEKDDSCFFNEYNNQLNRYCFSTKFSEYLSFTRPVITTTIGEANNHFKDGVNAFIVEPHNPQLIAEKIVYAMKHSEEAIKIGKEAHKLTLHELDCVYQTGRVLRSLNS